MASVWCGGCHDKDREYVDESEQGTLGKPIGSLDRHCIAIGGKADVGQTKRFGREWTQGGNVRAVAEISSFGAVQSNDYKRLAQSGRFPLGTAREPRLHEAE